MSEKIGLKPIEKESLYIKISDAIYSYIRVNQMKPGEKLPSEREMASILQTSRNSLREGLRILENQGLIDVQTGKGAFIKDPYGPESFFTVQLHGCSQEEVFELQAVLDRQIVKDAIRYASNKDKEKLVNIASELVEMADKGIYSHTIDDKFHSQLYGIAKNKAIQQTIGAIREYRFVLQQGKLKDNDDVWLKTVINHLYLAEAIYANNEIDAIKEIDIINEHGFSLADE